MLLSRLGFFSHLSFSLLPLRLSRPLLGGGFCISSIPLQRLPPILDFFFGSFRGSFGCAFFCHRLYGGRSSSSSSGPLGGTRGCSSLLVYSIPSAFRHWGSVGNESDWAESSWTTFHCLQSCFLWTSLLFPQSSRVRIISSCGTSSFTGSGPLIFPWPAMIPSWLPTLGTLLPFSSGRANFARLSSVHHLFENTDSKYFRKGFEISPGP